MLIYLLEKFDKIKKDRALYCSQIEEDTRNKEKTASFNCYENGKGFAMFPDFEGSAAILYKSIKQLTVSKSSTEAELISLKEAVMHILWVAQICQILPN